MFLYFSSLKLKFLKLQSYFYIDNKIKITRVPMNHNYPSESQNIVKIPCPHCGFLCSPQIQFCSKCGEPLPKVRSSEDSRCTDNSQIIESHAEKIIKFIEKEIQKPIPLTDNIKPNENGYKCEEGEITQLSLSKCGFNIIPARIMKLKTLKKLFLRRNCLKELPNSIGMLSNLEMLDLRINELKELPRSIGLLSNLKYLNISSNELFSIPETIGNLESLTFLNLNNNKLRSIPESLGNLKQLKELKIKANFWITVPECVECLQQNGSLIIEN